MVNNIVENDKVLSQNNGNKFAYITREGKLITAWSRGKRDEISNS